MNYFLRSCQQQSKVVVLLLVSIPHPQSQLILLQLILLQLILLHMTSLPHPQSPLLLLQVLVLLLANLPPNRHDWFDPNGLHRSTKVLISTSHPLSYYDKSSTERAYHPYNSEVEMSMHATVVPMF